MKALTSLPRTLWLSLLLSLLLVLQLSPAAAAQARVGAEGMAQLKSQAEACSRAFAEGDFNRLAEYTYPKVVKLIGGRAKLIEMVEQTIAEMKAEGLVPVSNTAGEPTQVVRVGRRTFGVVPVTLRVRSPKGIYVSESVLIGVSDDGGKKWTFVSGSDIGPERLKTLFPTAARRLKIPAPKPITVEPLP